MPTNSKLYIGAMSGTSHDAVDVSLISVTKKNMEIVYDVIDQVIK